MTKVLLVAVDSQDQWYARGKMFSVVLKTICYYVNTPTASPEVMLSHFLM